MAAGWHGMTRVSQTAFVDLGGETAKASQASLFLEADFPVALPKVQRFQPKLVSQLWPPFDMRILETHSLFREGMCPALGFSGRRPFDLSAQVKREDDLAKLVTKRDKLVAMKRKAELTLQKKETRETFRPNCRLDPTPPGDYIYIYLALIRFYSGSGPCPG